jgi:hypothetical protein
MCNVIKVVHCVGLSILLMGCAQSPIPMPANFPASTQLKVRAAGHWQAMSKDVAQNVARALRSFDNSRLVYVERTEPETVFDLAFRDLLATELINEGIGVSLRSENALTLTYRAKLVRHSSLRPDFDPGRYTKLTAGLWALGSIAADSAFGAGVATFSLAALKDQSDSANSNGPSATEIVLTTIIGNGKQMLSSSTSIYYIESADTSLYQPASPAPQFGKNMRVVQ